MPINLYNHFLIVHVLFVVLILMKRSQYFYYSMSYCMYCGIKCTWFEKGTDKREVGGNENDTLSHVSQ